MEAACTFIQTHVVLSLPIKAANDEGEVTESTFLLICAQRCQRECKMHSKRQGLHSELDSDGGSKNCGTILESSLKPGTANV